MSCQSLIAAGGSGEIVTDTYANLVILAAGSGLQISNLYVISDNTDAEAGLVVLRPINSSQFAREGSYIPSGDNTKIWDCEYDFANEMIVSIKDDLGNFIHGNAIVNSFPWLDTNVFENTIIQDSLSSLTITLTNGSEFNKNRITNSSGTISLDAHNMNNNTFINMTITVTDSEVVGNFLEDGSINISNDATLTQNKMKSGSMTVNNASASYNLLTNHSDVSVTDNPESFADNVLQNDASVTLIGEIYCEANRISNCSIVVSSLSFVSFYANVFESTSSLLWFDAEADFNFNNIKDNSQLSFNGELRFNGNNLDFYTLNVNAIDGVTTIERNDFINSTGSTIASLITTTVKNNHFAGTISLNTLDSCTVENNQFIGNVFSISNCENLDISFNTVESNSSISVDGAGDTGNPELKYNHLSSNSEIVKATGSTFNGTVNNNNISSGSSIIPLEGTRPFAYLKAILSTNN